MPFIPVENVAHVTIQGTLDSQEVINDLYFRHTTGPIAVTDLQSLNAAINLWFTGSVLTHLNEAYIYQRVKSRDLTTANGFVVDDQFGPTPGSVTGEAAPNNCTMSVSFRAAFAGRNFRGRNYVPCLTNSEVTENTIDSGFVSNIRNDYLELVAGGGSAPAGWTWVVVSRFTGGLPRAAGVFNEIFSVVIVDNIVDSQRRRLPGRGK